MKHRVYLSPLNSHFVLSLKSCGQHVFQLLSFIALFFICAIAASTQLLVWQY